MGFRESEDQKRWYGGRLVTVETDGLRGFSRNVTEDQLHFGKLHGGLQIALHMSPMGCGGAVELTQAREWVSMLTRDLDRMLGELDTGHLALGAASLAASERYGDTDCGSAEQMAALFTPEPGKGAVPPRRTPPAPAPAEPPARIGFREAERRAEQEAARAANPGNFREAERRAEATVDNHRAAEAAQERARKRGDVTLGYDTVPTERVDPPAPPPVTRVR